MPFSKVDRTKFRLTEKSIALLMDFYPVDEQSMVGANGPLAAVAVNLSIDGKTTIPIKIEETMLLPSSSFERVVRIGFAVDPNLPEARNLTLFKMNLPITSYPAPQDMRLDGDHLTVREVARMEIEIDNLTDSERREERSYAEDNRRKNAVRKARTETNSWDHVVSLMLDQAMIFSLRGYTEVCFFLPVLLSGYIEGRLPYESRHIVYYQGTEPKDSDLHSRRGTTLQAAIAIVPAKYAESEKVELTLATCLKTSALSNGGGVMHTYTYTENL